MTRGHARGHSVAVPQQNRKIDKVGPCRRVLLCKVTRDRAASGRVLITRRSKVEILPAQLTALGKGGIGYVRPAAARACRSRSASRVHGVSGKRARLRPGAAGAHGAQGGATDAPPLEPHPGNADPQARFRLERIGAQGGRQLAGGVACARHQRRGGSPRGDARTGRAQSEGASAAVGRGQGSGQEALDYLIDEGAPAESTSGDVERARSTGCCHRHACRTA